MLPRKEIVELSAFTVPINYHTDSFFQIVTDSPFSMNHKNTENFLGILKLKKYYTLLKHMGKIELTNFSITFKGLKFVSIKFLFHKVHNKYHFVNYSVLSLFDYRTKN